MLAMKLKTYYIHLIKFRNGCLVFFVEQSSTIECCQQPPPQIWKLLQANKLVSLNKQILSNKEKTIQATT
jgi:hypothetical protein